MNPKNTWLLVTVAVVLAGFIYGWEEFVAKPARQPVMVIPGLDPASIRQVQVRVAGEQEVLAVRTNSEWQLVKPLSGPARPNSVDAMLQTLAQLSPHSYLSARDLMSRPNAQADFGFETPSISIMLFSDGGRKQLLVGSHTAPGDQVFVELVGTPGVHLVSTNLLAVIPQKPADWRNTSLLEQKSLKFDRVQVNNGSRIMELVQNPTNQLWRLARLQARADGQMVEELLGQLWQMHIKDFVTDDPDAELTDYGLDAPTLEIILAEGSNTLATLQFGASTTNGTNMVYGRRGSSASIFTVSEEDLKPWRAPATDFRDRRFFSLRYVPDAIEVRGNEEFFITRETNHLWRVMPGNFIADTNYMNDVLLALAQMQIVEFVKDVVTQPDLPSFGLDPAVEEYTLKFNIPTEPTIHVLFGTNRDNVVFAKRADEPSVSALRFVDVNFLPAASWELRNRGIWRFTEEEVARIRIEQDGKQRELIRNGTNAWSLAEGSTGIINPFAVEETVHRLGDLSAAFWIAHGEIDRTQYGFSDPPHKIITTLKNGTTHEVELGELAPSQYPYALVMQDGEPWVFEFPWATAQFINDNLSITTP